MTLSIFLCHSNEDKEAVRKLYQKLRDDDFNPWLDEENLLPGQDWRKETPKAVRASNVVLVCLSKASISKSGYVQSEIKLALDVAREQPPGTIFIIPVRLEDCAVPDELEGLQWVNVYEERGYDKLLLSLHRRASTLGQTLPVLNNAPIEGSASNSTEPFEPRASASSRGQKPLKRNPPTVLGGQGGAVIDLAIEIENYHTRIRRNDNGGVLSEPSIVAIRKQSNKVEAIGRDAEGYLNSTGDVIVYRTMKDNKVGDPDLASLMLHHLISKACAGNGVIRKRVVVTIPSELTQIERKAFVDIAYRAKADEVYLCEKILCAALGAGLSVTSPTGSLILNVSESATDVMAISHGQPAAFKSIRGGTNEMNKNITRYIERKYDLVIGERTAESIRAFLGSAFPLEEPLSMEVRGRSLIEGIPKTITVTDDDVLEALGDSISFIINAVREVLQRTPGELSAEIIERGITLTGSGATLKNLDKRLKIETSLPVFVPEDPVTSVVRGAAIMLSNSNLPLEGRVEASPKPITKFINSIIGVFLQPLSSDLAIDVGAKNTLLYAKGRGIVVSESSIVAVNKFTYDVEAIGNSARGIIGRAPSSIIPIHPVENGVITNFDVAVKMLRHFIRKAHRGRAWVMPRVVMPVRASLSKAERDILRDAAYCAKASEVYLVEEAMAAAIGAGLPITEPHGNMIVDIGGGTTDIAVISLSGIVYSRAVRVAGNEMDEHITSYIKRRYNLLIGERTAENIKIWIGSAYPLDEALSMDVRGRNLIEGIPKTIIITDDEAREALADSVSTIVNAIRFALERTPPELSADIVERGILLTGGGALLKNLDKRIAIETGLPVSVAEDPLSSVIVGAGKMLMDINLIRRLKLDTR